MVQCCLNGPHTSGVPITPAELAASAAEAVAAGATDLHLHPKGPDGRDSLAPGTVAAALSAVREAVDVPVGVTTGAWAQPDPAARLALIEEWDVLPDHASVNWHESGAEAVAAALDAHGIGIEAGVWTVAAAEAFRRRDPALRVLRILVEVTDVGAAHDVLAALGVSPGATVLLHGEDAGTWPVLRLAGRLGLPTRIGLEDTRLLPDGSPAASNAELVRAALRLGPRAGDD